jgi:long-subunit acyl-CoA synthetase (AMP-forming)
MLAIYNFNLSALFYFKFIFLDCTKKPCYMSQTVKVLIDSFYDLEKANANDVYLRQPFGSKWEEYTYAEVGQMARKVAAYLKSLNLPANSNIGLISKNCREWIIADLAIMMSGHVSVPLYATLTEDTLGEVLDIGDVKMLFAGKLDNWDMMKAGVPAEMPVVKFPQYANQAVIDRGTDWQDILDKHGPITDSPVPNPEDLWTIVFTSGTTGTPKGVMHTYQILMTATEHTIETNNLQMEKNNNRFFSYLPLNHIAERMAVEAQSFYWGGTISFPESLDTFAANLQDTKPTLFFGVPRIYTKLQLGILAKMPQKKLDKLTAIPIIGGFIKNKIKKGLGLDAARVILVGAAPMSKQDKNWWKALGMPISEGYGMTENLGAATFMPADIDKPGSIGQFYNGTEVRIDPDTQEIQTKCPWNMLGYYKNPEKTEEVLKGGWLHTGDQGRVDEHGYVYLTGRVKDTFKTAKGQYVVPAPLEFKFADNMDIEQICVCGLGLPQPIALVVPSEIGKNKSKDELGKSLSHTLHKANTDLPGYKKISHVMVVNEDWGIENNILTPTLKVKRTEVDKKYLDTLHEVCKCADPVYWE